MRRALASEAEVAEAGRLLAALETHARDDCGPLALADWPALSSLFDRELALITRLALRVHGSLPPAMVRYTRGVTALWAAYFLLMALASCALFVFGSLRAWSILANLVTLPLVALIFVGEYLVRLRLHPRFDHVSLLDGVRAFMEKPAREGGRELP